MLYLLQRLPFEQKLRPADVVYTFAEGAKPRPVEIAPGDEKYSDHQREARPEQPHPVVQHRVEEIDGEIREHEEHADHEDDRLKQLLLFDRR